MKELAASIYQIAEPGADFAALGAVKSTQWYNAAKIASRATGDTRKLAIRIARAATNNPLIYNEPSFDFMPDKDKWLAIAEYAKATR